jgi:hypothetical protein
MASDRSQSTTPAPARTARTIRSATPARSLPDIQESILIAWRAYRVARGGEKAWARAVLGELPAPIPDGFSARRHAGHYVQVVFSSQGTGSHIYLLTIVV